MQQGALCKFIERLTIRKILIIALIFRLLPAFFSRGYGMYDDHFLVIEIAQSWVDGNNIDNWLPDAAHGITEPKYNMLYAGINFILLKLFQLAGMHDPQLKMLFIRLFHALYSLLVVYYGFKIAKKLTDETCAKYVGLLLSLLWFIPNLSVRNLVEMFCIPPLLYGIWGLLNEKGEFKQILWTGFIAGFAFSLRYQTALFIAGMGLVLLFQKKWKTAFVFAAGCLLNILIFQVAIDFALWGHPLAQFIAYLKFNITHRNEFVTGPWYNYALLLTGLIIPPLSLMLWYGYFRSARKYLLLFLPSLLFLAFHSAFSNKQERFILPFVPYLVIQGTCGWYDFQKISTYWKNHSLLLRRLLWFAFIVNSILLGICCVSSTKTSKMNAMYYLYQRGDTHSFIIEGSYQDGVKSFPLFYLGKWVDWYFIKSDYSAGQLKQDLKNSPVQPNYVVFLSDKNLEPRVAKFKESYPHIEELATIEPSFIDKVFFKLNPVNQNEPCFVYKINY